MHTKFQLIGRLISEVQTLEFCDVLTHTRAQTFFLNCYLRGCTLFWVFWRENPKKMIFMKTKFALWERKIKKNHMDSEKSINSFEMKAKGYGTIIYFLTIYW